MPRSVAFLRGVNLGRNRRVSGAELRSIFEEELGFTGAETFRTSGNVVFDPGRASGASLRRKVEKGLADTLGYEVAVFLRKAGAIRAIAAHEPFPAKVVEASDGKLQVAMLTQEPSAALRQDVLAHSTDDDRLAFGDRELYWLPRGGMSDSALDMKTIDKLVGPTTVRTKGTIELMARRYFAG